MIIKLFDLIDCSHLDCLVIGSPSQDEHLSFLLSDFDYDLLKFKDYLRLHGWIDVIVNWFNVNSSDVGIVVWIQEWSYEK